MSSSGEGELREEDHIETDSENASTDDENQHSEDEDEGQEPIHMHRNVVLRDFFRLFAGPRFHAQESATDNKELVDILKDLRVVKSSRVERALLMCPRGTFIPADYAEDAYFDAPIRVEHMEFNISAPHMHATCLEALELQPGDKCAAIRVLKRVMWIRKVGTSGECVAAEIKQQILDFSISCLNKLREENPSYIRESCNIQFLLRNAFIPTSHKEYFDKVHVGGTCPEERLPNLIRMLKIGGKMTVPVGQELRLITRVNNGTQQKVLTQVRFSDLAVPSDADIVLSTMKSEIDEKMKVAIPPSTLKEDTKLVRRLSEGPSNGETVQTDELHPIGAEMVKRSISHLLRRRSAEEPKQNPIEEIDLDLVQSTKPDCVLVGEEWTLSTHRIVLKVRSEYFRARFESDMQDSEDYELTVPSQFSQEAMSLFLQYIYKDELPDNLSAQIVIDVMHVACYYGVPRLVVLCESLLASALKRRHEESPEEAAEFAASLLTLANANGLSSLQDVVLQYIVEHFDLVSQTTSYKELTKREVDLIMNESFGRQQRFKRLLADLSGAEHTH